MKYSSPTAKKSVSTLFAGVMLAGTLILAGCSDHMITGPDASPTSAEVSGPSVNVTNQDASHNGEQEIHADKNGENSTTYGGDHNL